MSIFFTNDTRYNYKDDLEKIVSDENIKKSMNHVLY